MTLGLPKSHFFLKLSQNEKASEASERAGRAKRAGRRKQSIFGFNHIDPRIQEEKLEEIKKLFRFFAKERG